MTFHVEDFRDLVRILEEKPEWRAELRRLILTDELLALPEQFAAFRTETERRFEELAAAQKDLAAAHARHEEQLAALRAETERRFAELAEALSILARDVAELKGDNLERRYRERAPAYLGRLVRRAHALSTEEVAALVEGAVAEGRLSEDQGDDLILSDLVVRGRRRDDGREVFLVLEISWGAGPEDVERAARRAEILSRLGTPAVAIVAGRSITAEAVRLAHRKQVWQITDGIATAPATP